jgi:uncharacterized protein YndB with AHSA1/START domain
MSATAIAPSSVEKLMLNITSEIHVKASLETTFEALLQQLSSDMPGADAKPMNLKIEAWPGGRWYRDLGNNNGHFWAHVQAIKRPTLLELCGPPMMSYAVISNVQYRLTEEDGGTLITFHHYAVGVIPDDVRQGLTGGWGQINEGIRKIAEAKR